MDNLNFFRFLSQQLIEASSRSQEVMDFLNGNNSDMYINIRNRMISLNQRQISMYNDCMNKSYNQNLGYNDDDNTFLEYVTQSNEIAEELYEILNTLRGYENVQHRELFNMIDIVWRAQHDITDDIKLKINVL